MSEAARQVPAKEIPSKPQTFTAKAFAANSATSPLAPFTLARRSPRPQDVQIEILFCGVCHSDLHQVRNEWERHAHVYPVRARPRDRRPRGQGRQRRQEVQGRRPGRRRLHGGFLPHLPELPRRATSSSARHGPPSPTTAPDKHLGGVTYGGYSDSIVVDEAFVLRVSDKLDPAGAAPLLCAGITTYSPLRHWKVGKGQKVGIVGLGGLGHMGVKFAHAFGAHVVLFTTSPDKTADATRLGAHEVVVSKDADEMQKHAGSFDFILDTVSADARPQRLPRPPEARRHADARRRARQTRCRLRLQPDLQRRRLAGSLIGGIRETQEMLDFCAEHGITSDVEIIPIQQINEAYERMLKGDVKYRFVIDMASLK